MKKIIFSLCLSVLLLNPIVAQWTDITPPSLPNVRDIAVINDKSAVLLGNDSLNYHLYKTLDGGMTWTAINPPLWINSDPMDWEGIVFPDEQHGFIYGTWQVDGGFYAGGSESFVLFGTTDGGNTWKALMPDLWATGFRYISSIHFFNALQGFTILERQLVKTTDDGGLSWQTQDSVKFSEYSKHLNADGTGIVLGYDIGHDSNHHPHYYKTFKLYQVEDFGKKWTFIGDPETDMAWPEHRKGLWFDNKLHINDSLIFRHRFDAQISGNGDDIRYYDKSTDGGSSWQEGFFEITGKYVNRFEVLNNSVWVQTWSSLHRQGQSILPTTPVCLWDVDLRLSPNPVATGALIQFRTDASVEGTVEIRIFSTAGKLVANDAVHFQSGLARLQVPVLAKGGYAVQVKYEGKQVVKKLEIF